MAAVSTRVVYPQPNVCFMSQQCIDELDLLDKIKDGDFPRLVSEVEMSELVRRHILLEMNILRSALGRCITEPHISIRRIGGRHYVTLTAIAANHSETFII